MSIQQNIGARDHFFVGEDITVQFTTYDDADAIVNVTGWTTEFRAAATRDGASVLSKNGTVLDGPNGVLAVAFLRADTVSLDPAEYHYAYSRTDSNLNQVLAHGKLTLLPRPA